MMIQKLIVCCLFTVAFSSTIPSTLYAESRPILNNGKQWRIAYYEGGPYSDYTDTMRTLLEGLTDLGWLAEEEMPDIHGDVPKPYMEWLGKVKSPYLSFQPDDVYSAMWDEENRKKIKEQLLGKLKAGAIDLVIAMGTWAGIDLANNEHSVPVMVLSTSDPIAAGIIKSVKDSGHDHVTARVDPDRYLRQLRMFHRLVRFKTLGIAYENTPEGLIYSAVKEARQTAKERGFQLLLCEVQDSIPDIQVADQSCLNCFKKLSEEAEAIYVTALTCADRNTEVIADIITGLKRPSFSMIGSKYVKKGLLVSVSSDSGYEELGKYNAFKFGEILNGTKPRNLPQLFGDPLDIAINIQTAREIGFKVPKSILDIATEIYP